ncbi:MAG: disulfide bond formation protein B [Patescibacteria group bacterium]|jgi:disulfide bond formation protein DsbB
MQKLLSWISKQAYVIVFIISAFGMVGSLYYSEILGLTPCLLCWYQRISLYPIVLISAMALWFEDKKAYRYILALIAFGTLISIYQNLLYYGIIPEKLAPCILGVSCTTRYDSWLAFVPIPLQALGAHLAILAVMIVKWREERKTA